MAEKNVLDLRGIVSPLDLLKCKSCLNAMKKGECVEVILDDDDVAKNLTLIIERSNDELLYSRNAHDCICIGIAKGSGLADRK